MIKELIFQKQKWYQSEMPNYIGKKISIPSDIANYPYEFYPTGGFSSVPVDNQPTEGTIEGQINYEGKTYVFIGTYYENGGETFWYDVSQVKIQNGGVTSLLSHIRRGLQSLLRNEVIACL